MIHVAWSPLYNHPLNTGHRFPMEKYDLIPQQLMYEGTLQKENFFEPEEMDMEVILLTHEASYVNRLLKGEMSPKEMRRIGFPYSKGLIERECSIMYGSIQAALFALDNGIAFNMAGGTHHAFKDQGEGFCIFNDIAVAANYLLREEKAKKLLVIDLDVHQGNGTASIFSGSNEVFTFSMHGRHNFPLHKEKSHLDIELEDGTGDALYLSILAETLPELIETVKPDFIFYQCGVDVLKTDKLGRMALSRDGCKERDFMVLNIAHRHGIPLTAVMGGSYSEKITDIVEAHGNTFRVGVGMWG
jgi:acetoin utilization deacetylase AcuC-like enzyme